MTADTAVIFDLDDTLYQERRFALSGYAAVASRVAEETGMPRAVLFRFLVQRFRARGRERLLQTWCAEFALPVADVPSYVDVIRTHVPRVRLPARSRRVLAALRTGGYRLGVLTNGLPPTQPGKVEALGLAALVDITVYANECAPGGKPAIVCFQTVLQRLGVAASSAVFVGDHLDNDIAGAAAAGLSTIWLPGRQPHATRPAAVHAIATTLGDVPSLVTALLEARRVPVC